MKYYLAKMEYSIKNKIDFTWYAFIDGDQKDEINKILTEAKIDGIEISVGKENLYNDSFTVDDLDINYYDIPKSAVQLFKKLNNEDKAFNSGFWDVIYSFDEYLDIDSEEDYEDYEKYPEDTSIAIKDIA